MMATTVVVALAIGLASGLASGVLGIGGGLLMVPGMVLLLGLSQHVAEGTSLLVIIPTATVGTWTHWRNGFVVVRLAIALGIGGIVGALVGSHVALGLSGPTLRYIFVAYLMVMGARLLLPPGGMKKRAKLATQAAVDTPVPEPGMRDST
jgi:uncharacterized membrane protein YfcA